MKTLYRCVITGYETRNLKNDKNCSRNVVKNSFSIVSMSRTRGHQFQRLNRIYLSGVWQNPNRAIWTPKNFVCIAATRVPPIVGYREIRFISTFTAAIGKIITDKVRREGFYEIRLCKRLVRGVRTIFPSPNEIYSKTKSGGGVGRFKHESCLIELYILLIRPRTLKKNKQNTITLLISFYTHSERVRIIR